ncbi:MAG: 1-acyl-sn-glycerol-3-phosphate acyltransferase [Labilithrix sp.]|nr:1-acyl-sn-glycerol-3-phosphate acyltransferase [Labilithrix sp.]
MGVRSALLVLFRRIARIYFREIEVAGEVPHPRTGGRLFAANHVNGLVDPILVLTQAPCPISPVAKSTLWNIPGLKWLLEAAEAVPIVRRRDVPGKSESDNEAVFVRVASHLVTGGNILIFPEGTSHNEPHLIALRSGAGRMLSRARAEEGGDELTFQAVALEFDARDVFRSRSLVLFGPVRRVADMPGADLAQEITDTLREDLSELLVEGSTWEERVLVVRVAEMFAKDADDASLTHLNQIGRRIEEARRVLARSSPDDVRAIEERLRSYVRRLDEAETSDEVVAHVARRAASDAPLEVELEPDRIARAAAMIATLPLALIAVVLYWLPYQLPRFVTRKLDGDPDVASTYKLGVGLVVYPVWAAATIALAFVELPSVGLALAAGAVVLASPFAALAWLDRWDHLAARASSLLAPPRERRERLVALAAERTGLMQDLDALRERAETS